MVDLDSASIYSKFDSSGMLRHLHVFPEQCMRAWQKVMAFDLPVDYSRVSRVVILGMGGSAIGGDIVQRLAFMESKVPVWVHRDYGLPAFVDESTLVVASSYSGNTEETLSAFNQSLRIPARKVVITSGGELSRLAEAEGIPAYLIDYRAPPRAAFPHSFVPLLGIFQKLGLIEDKAADLREAVQILTGMTGEITETQPHGSNPAKQMAARLKGRVAVIYGAEMMSEVARRWTAQINENSKNWAFCETLPELNHNVVIGYSFPAEAKERMLVIMLSSRSLGSRNALRYRATAELLTEAGISYEIVESRGESILAQIMGLVLLGDYCSFYLAMLNEVDPTTIDAIDFVKQYLARHESSAS